MSWILHPPNYGTQTQTQTQPLLCFFRCQVAGDAVGAVPVPVVPGAVCCPMVFMAFMAFIMAEKLNAGAGVP